MTATPPARPAARKTTADYPPEILGLFDQYVHGVISRRGFLDAAARRVAGVAAAEILLAELSPDFARAQQVAPGDTRIQSTVLEFPSPKGYGTVHGLLVRPSGVSGPLPVVLVVHENRGLNPHIEDIARRLALAGYIAYAPDALHPLGGYPGDEDRARALFARLDQEKARQDFLAAAMGLRNLPQGNGKLGVIGFCWGGGMANVLATRLPGLDAAVAFYGPQPAAAEAARIKAPLMLHYAGEDKGITGGWPAYEAALKAAGVHYEAFVYPGVEHGFNNDTTPRYDAVAARLAWQRTLDFFHRYLGG